MNQSAVAVLPRLQSDDELWAIASGDTRAREELVRRHIPFARLIASRYQNGRESFDDLLQVASVGLLNAVNRFDPSNGAPFTAFASPTIHGELKRYFRDRVWIVRVPRGLQEEILDVDKATATLSASLQRTPTPEELAEHMGVDPESIDRVAMAREQRIPVSIDSPIGDGGESRAEVIGSEDPGFRMVESTDEVRSAMKCLHPQDRLVMRLRFIEELTQSEIADRVGCSQMHISRVLRRCVETIQSQTQAAA